MEDIYRKKIIVLELKGAIHGFTSEQIDKALLYWLNVANGGVVLIDLSGVESIDSLGIEVLVKGAVKGNLALCKPSTNLMQMFNCADSSSRLNFYKDIEEAIEKLNVGVLAFNEPNGERRCHQRTDICSPTKFKITDGKQSVTFKGVITNISLGGLLIEYLDRVQGTNELTFSPGMLIEQLEMNSLKSDFTVNGTLARLSNRHGQLGLGISFKGLTEEEKEPIVEYISNKGKTHLMLRR